MTEKYQNETLEWSQLYFQILVFLINCIHYVLTSSADYEPYISSQAK